MLFDLNILNTHKPRIGDHREYKEFAILIPIVQVNGQESIVFQIRSNKLVKQPNEICFPGGKIEVGESPVDAAVRETSEEMLLGQEKIQVLGEIDTLVTPFNSIIYPFVAKLDYYQGSFSHEEVQEIFYVPLDYLMNYTPQISNMDVLVRPQTDFPFEKVHLGQNYPWARGSYPVYFYEFEGKFIWGITARILRNFLEIITQKTL